MEPTILRQLRLLQFSVCVLSMLTALLLFNLFHPLISVQHFKEIDAYKVNIREADGTLKASLSNAAGFRVFGRSQEEGRFSGLMFYNEEGAEQGGLVYEGRKLPAGQRQSAGITFDQYREDQNIYLHHDEQKDDTGYWMNDGLTVRAHPDYTLNKKEYEAYAAIEKLPENEREAASLKAAQDGTISTTRIFLGVSRGSREAKLYDDTGLFIRNKWGQKTIRLYVDNDNKPHFEIYDPLGKTLLYELKIATPSHK